MKTTKRYAVNDSVFLHLTFSPRVDCSLGWQFRFQELPLSYGYGSWFNDPSTRAPMARVNRAAEASEPKGWRQAEEHLIPMLRDDANMQALRP